MLSLRGSINHVCGDGGNVCVTVAALVDFSIEICHGVDKPTKFLQALRANNDV